jgi:hypothetical protein
MSSTITTDGPVSSNGSTPPTTDSAGEAVEFLRRKPRNLHLVGGFGPLVLGVVFFLLMLWAAPSVAPEHVVQRPATSSSSTTSTTTAVTTTAVPTP